MCFCPSQNNFVKFVSLLEVLKKNFVSQPIPWTPSSPIARDRGFHLQAGERGVLSRSCIIAAGSLCTGSSPSKVIAEDWSGGSAYLRILNLWDFTVGVRAGEDVAR